MKSSINYRYISLLTTVAALGGILFGFDIAIITGANPFIQDLWGLTEIQLGMGTSALLFGCIPGAILAGILTDKLGRKSILLFVAFWFAVTSIATALSPTFDFYVIARFAGGIAVGAASLVSPMYISEVAVSSIRGRMVSVYQLSIVFGILISYGINYLLKGVDHNWQWMFATGVFPSVLFFVLLFVVPETPRFLYKQGKLDKAFEVLTKIGGADNAKIEIEQIKASLTGAKVSFRTLFEKKIFKIVLVGFGLAVFIQVSGINAIIDYSPFIFKSAGFSMDAALFATFGLGIVNTVFTFVSIWAIDKFGRKPLYLIGSAGMTLAMVFLTLVKLFEFQNGTIVLIVCVVYLAFFSSCIGPVFWTLVSEIFPNKIRGRAMSVPVFVQWLFNALMVLVFPHFHEHMPVFTFAFISVMALLQFLFTWKWVPETKGKSLEEIEKYWGL